MVYKSPAATIKIHTSLFFDAREARFLDNVSLTVDPSDGLIASVWQRSEPLPSTIRAPDIDLRDKTVIPGLVDAHTHIFLHGYDETPALNQTRDESVVERIIRATNHCRTALLAGYTTYRDLGTESAGDCDVHIRDAINRGLIPGPRIFCATEALASSGGYEIRHENALGGVQVPRLSDPCDGIDGVRAGVRRRLAAGADLIKFYADYRKRPLRWPESSWPGSPPIQFPPPSTIPGRPSANVRNPSLPLFTQDEMNTIVAEARAARAPVAAHAQSALAVEMASNAGVTSVEHAFETWPPGLLATLRHNHTILVPTLATLELYIPDVTLALAQVKAAFDANIPIAAGGDTGAFPHGDNVRELELLLQAGLPLEQVLQSATLTGWHACGGDWAGRKFGCLEKGYAADLVAFNGDLRADRALLRQIDFVMKDARVWKANGHAVGMV